MLMIMQRNLILPFDKQLTAVRTAIEIFLILILKKLEL